MHVCHMGVAVNEQEVPRGFEPRSLDSESRVLTVTPRDQMLYLRRPRRSANLSELVYEVSGSWLAREGLAPHPGGRSATWEIEQKLAREAQGSPEARQPCQTHEGAK